MIFTVNLDAERLKKIKPFCGTYVDIICVGNFALFCSETGQSYVQAPMDLIGVHEQIPNVRISSDLLFNVMISGIVKFFIEGSTVEVVFYGTENKQEFKLVVPRQVSAISAIEKNRLILKSKECLNHSLIPVQRLIRLISKTKSPFIVSEGFAFMFYKNSYVFQKVELPSFACDSDLIKKCIALTTQFCFCEDYMVFTSEGVSVLVHKQKIPNVCDIAYIQKTKASRVIDVDLSKMTTLVNRLKANDYEVKVDLDSRFCLVKWDVNRFEIPIKVLGDSNSNQSIDDLLADFNSEEITPNDKDSSFTIPYWTLRLLDKVSKVKIYVTKRFYLIKVEKVFITVNRGKSNEV